MKIVSGPHIVIIAVLFWNYVVIIIVIVLESFLLPEQFMINMAFPVVEFPRQGYKIRKVFG